MSIQFPDWFNELVQKDREFTQHFLPPDKSSAHDFLYDFQTPSEYAPPPALLQKCLQDYAGLLERAVACAHTMREAELAADALVNSSELVLAFLDRGDSNAIESGGVAQRIAACAETLAALGKEPSLDAFKRLISVGVVLAELGKAKFNYDSEKDFYSDDAE